MLLACAYTLRLLTFATKSVFYSRLSRELLVSTEILLRQFLSGAGLFDFAIDVKVGGSCG